MSAKSASSAPSVSSVSPAQFVELFSLGALGYFAKVTLSEPVSKKGVASVSALTIFVVDRSGSMGTHFCTVIREIIPKTMMGLGYSGEDMVKIITFDSNTDQFSAKVKELGHDKKECQGMTNMSGIFSELSKVFSVTPTNVPINVIVISDGEIGDAEQTIASAKNIATKIARSAPICVLPVRLKTSGSSNPDTKALACVAMLNSSGPVPIVEFDININRDVKVLVDILSNHMRHSVVTYGTIVSHSAVLKTLPHTKPLTELALSSKVSYILIEPTADLAQIELNGVSLCDTLITEIASEDEISSFVDFVMSWLKIRLVVGQKDADFMTVINWFKELQQILESKASATSSNVLMRDRVQLVRNSIKKRSSSLLNQVLQLANESRLDKLNSNQMAEYLRSNVKSKATARRIEENSNGLSPDDMAKHIFKTMFDITVNSDGDDVGSGNISFWSQSGCAESLFSAKDLGNTADVEANDVLQLSGGLGLCFSSRKTDLPDPWQFKAEEVFAGNLYLSESDIRTSSQLKFPSTDKIITGVVPLMSLNPDLYKLYNFGSLKKLSELHAGISIRGVLGPIPYDVLAMNTGVLRKLISDIGPNNQVTSIQTELVTGLIDQIRAHVSTYANESFRPIADALCETDPRPFLIGNNDANAVSKIVAILFGHSACEPVRSDKQKLQNIMAILYDLEAYHRSKHIFRESDDYKPEKTRDQALVELLDVNIEAYRTSTFVGNPFEPDPVFESIVKVDFAKSAERLPHWCPSVEKFASLFRWLDTNGASLPVTNCAEAFGTDNLDLLKLWATVHAINSKCENDRVDKENNIAKSPLPNSATVSGSIQEIVDDICRADFEKRLAEKRITENKLTLDKLIMQLMAVTSEGEFATLLNEGINSVTIKDRSSIGYDDLVEKLTNVDIDVNIRLRKIGILVTGRDSTGAIVWVNGNVLRGKFDRFAEAFSKLGKREMWEKIRAVVLENTKHTYRSGGFNRHGHGNTKPSYFALGFEQLCFFENACKNKEGGYTLKDWEEYVGVHRGCCGFSR